MPASNEPIGYSRLQRSEKRVLRASETEKDGGEAEKSHTQKTMAVTRISDGMQHGVGCSR